MPTKKELQGELDKLGVKYKEKTNVEGLTGMLDAAREALPPEGSEDKETGLDKLEGEDVEIVADGSPTMSNEIPKSVICLSCHEKISADVDVCPLCSAENLQRKTAPVPKEDEKEPVPGRTCRRCGCTNVIEPNKWDEGDTEEGDICQTCTVGIAAPKNETKEDTLESIKAADNAQGAKDTEAAPDDPGDEEEYDITLPNLDFCDACSKLTECGTLGGHKKCVIYGNVMIPQDHIRINSYGCGSMLRPKECKTDQKAKVKR